MSAASLQRRPKREVIDVAEVKPEDRRLDKLIHVRKQRLNRYERERNEAREAWRAVRRDLRETKQAWRDALQEAREFWEDARAAFFRMSLTSGQFRKAKAIYERMKSEAGQHYLACCELVRICGGKRQAYFAARLQVLAANRQQEKLSILRDELRAAQTQPEA